MTDTLAMNIKITTYINKGGSKLTDYTYKVISQKAKNIKNNVENKQELIEKTGWSYYIAKSILNPKKNIPKILVKSAQKPTGSHISRQISRADYLNSARWLTKYVETKNQLPNYIPWNNKLNISTPMYTYLFANVLDYYNTKGLFPTKRNVNTKIFTKPTETPNVVYDYTCKKFGKKFTTIDELLTYVAKYFTYLFYYDDYKSNKEVTDTKSGNCTDLLQWLINNAKAMGYEWKCLHVMCSSGVGHVRGMFRHKTHTGNKWIYRDIACVADNGSVTCNWCNSNFELLDTNPDWFIENLNR